MKLWSFETHPPIGDPLRHKGPIRNLAFFDESKLLVTTSDVTMKLWDALSGKPRGELEGRLNPLLHPCYSAKTGRFVTVDAGHRLVTLRDATTLKPVATFRSEGPAILAAALTEDGGTLATFGEGRTIELRDLATNRVFATLRPPAVVTEVFGKDDKSINQSKLERIGGRFWEQIRSLGPEGHDRTE